LVDQVTQARATVLLNNARDNVEAYPAVILLDGKNRQVGSLTAQPENLQVTVPITQQGGYRDLAVKIITTGQVATGYRLSSIAVIPPVVTVYSEDPALVDGLPGFVETEPLNLEGANANIEVRLMLVLPEGVSVIGDPTVLVQANISPIESSVIIADKKVDIIGLGPNLAAQIAPDTVDVILTGPLPVLDQLKINDVRVVIDLTGLSTGIHQVEPKVILRVDEVKVESVNPSTLEVTISYKSLLIPSSQP
jgi:YbbR domain-containing protein